MTTYQEIKAERRRAVRRERSLALANRKGLCRVCGAEMKVSRGTKTTCSDRCRKQWIRKGDEAFPLPETTDKVLFKEGAEPMPLADALELIRSKHRSVAYANITARFTGAEKQEAVEADLKRILAQLERWDVLLKLRTEAPAVFLWELSQQVDPEQAHGALVTSYRDIQAGPCQPL